jgi:hypothetical protein
MQPDHKERLPTAGIKIKGQKAGDVILMRFKVFTVVKTITSFKAKYGDCIFVRNVGICRRVYTPLTPRTVTTST